MNALSTFIGVSLAVTPNTAIFPEIRMTVKSLRALNVAPQFCWNGMGELCLRSSDLQANSSDADQPGGHPVVTIIGRLVQRSHISYPCAYELLRNEIVIMQDEVPKFGFEGFHPGL